MTAIGGARDTLLQATAERFSTTADGKALLMGGSTPVFRVNSAGAGAPGSIAITAKPVNVVGDIVFSVSAGTQITVNGNVATVDFSTMTTDTALVQATIREFGVDYIANYMVSKVFDGLEGQTGLAGMNTGQAFAYKRADAAPTDSPGDVIFTFATASITTPAGNDLANGWSKNIPAGTAPLYVRVAAASSRNATDNIAANEWAGAVQLAKDGMDGVDGTNTAQAFAYKRAAAEPGDSPGDVVYTFASAGITTPAGSDLANGWSKAIPAGTAPLYVSVAAASSRNATDAIAANEWTAAVLLAKDGTPGQNGVNVAPVRIYQRAAANVAPVLPGATCTFTFATGVLTGLNNGWSTQVPTAGGAYLFTSGATAASIIATDDIAASEWAAAARMAADGENGVDGLNVAPVRIYQRGTTNTAPELPSAVCTFTFATGALTGLNNGWSTQVPTAGGAYLFTSAATAASRTATDDIQAVEWAAAARLAADGATGQRGTVTVTAPGYSTWSDASAVYELGHAGYGAPINRDVVTLYDATHAVTKYFENGAWLVLGTVLNGNLLVNGSVATQALAADSVTAEKIDARGLSIKDAAGNIILSAGTPLTANYMNAGIGAGNLISNSAPAPPTAEGIGGLGSFALDYSYSLGTTTFAASYAPFVPSGSGGVYVRITGTVAEATTAAIVGVRLGAVNRKFPVIPGVRYEFSAYMSAHRCRGAVNIAFYDVNGAYLTEVPGSVVSNNSAAGGLANWGRSTLFATAPVGAAFAFLRSVLVGNGGTDVYLFLSMWYFGAALAAQTVPSAWADGPGASFGDNLYGQITPTNSPTYIANAAIVNAQIGGDIYSSNWNGSTEGWLLDRDGNFYANSGNFRGALSGVTGSFGMIRSPGRAATGTGSGYDLSGTGWSFYDANNVPRIELGEY